MFAQLPSLCMLFTLFTALLHTRVQLLLAKNLRRHACVHAKTITVAHPPTDTAMECAGSLLEESRLNDVHVALCDTDCRKQQQRRPHPLVCGVQGCGSHTTPIKQVRNCYYRPDVGTGTPLQGYAYPWALETGSRAGFRDMGERGRVCGVCVLLFSRARDVLLPLEQGVNACVRACGGCRLVPTLPPSCVCSDCAVCASMRAGAAAATTDAGAAVLWRLAGLCECLVVAHVRLRRRPPTCRG
jgi:hypothetical protein